MAKGKRLIPEVVIVNGERHVLCVLAVIGRDDKGLPTQFQRIGMDQKVQLSENEEDNVFVTGYMHEKSLNVSLDDIRDEIKKQGRKPREDGEDRRGGSRF